MIEFEINTNKKQIDFEVTQGIPKYVPANFQSKTVIPTTEQQIVRADIGYDGLEQVTVEKINLSNKTITENGTYNAENENIDGYSSVEVNVQPTLQEKSVTITENGTTEVVADNGYDGLAKVSVEANVKDNSLLNVIKGLNSYNTSNYPFELTADMFDENSTEIGQYKFYSNKNIIKAEIPTSIKTIYTYAFAGCTNLKQIRCQGVTTIYTEAFQGAGLEEINEESFPSLEDISRGAFNNLDSLKRVIMPSIKKVSDWGLCNSDNIDYVRLDSVTTILNQAFIQSRVKVFDFRGVASVPTLGGTSSPLGYKNSIVAIIIPDALYDDWIAATNWSALYAQSYPFIKASEYVEA